MNNNIEMIDLSNINQNTNSNTNNVEAKKTNPSNPNNISILEMYGENLSRKEYVTNPAIGRDSEIEQAIVILLTPEKSALLVGKAGVGKTAIVEGIGYRMKNGMIPNALKPYELIKVNISSLLGETKVGEGQSENRLQLLVDELKTKKNINERNNDLNRQINEKEELINIKGGANWVALGIGSTLVSFLIGLVDGQIKLK